MKNSSLTTLRTTSTSIMLIITLFSLTSALLSPPRASGLDSVTGAVWTSDPYGEQVNGNLYTNPRKVYLVGGPHKEGAAGLPDGIYYFQITDPSGKTLLSTDALSNRKFEVKNGYIHNIDGGTHKWNLDTTRGYGIVIQLWPFTYTPQKGGVYKVWVTREDHYSAGQGCFGFMPSLSKTDNFKVKLDEVPKYFELWLTEGISGPQDVEFYVNYTTDGDGDAGTVDPVLPWTTGRLLYQRTENGYDIFRYETTFPLDTYIYWKFFILNTFTWTSDLHGPERIVQADMVNKETLFMINGHKYNYRDSTPLEGWTIELHKDAAKIAETQTDPDGYYEFIGLGSGNYLVQEIVKSDEGWANATPTSYQFTVDGSNGGDHTFDFYNYEMLEISDSSDSRTELSSFNVVFTPSNDDSGMYKLSSTNPGSFYYNALKYGTAGGPVRIEVRLPRDQENADYDSPNFIFHHTEIGTTSTVDIHVYEAVNLTAGDWVPDWSTDVTNMFSITTTPDGKNATITGNIPTTGSILVTVHIDYQISASLTWEQVQTFSDFEYTFSTTVYASIQGVTRRFEIS
ncbi:MAG: hypothetical protein JSV87_03040 [Candidatus Bathyarchaeota archaeon]|nr:MAG: hypothetical protein JSV87_03040 [Candidatus Bathyarchaeota archaeon]